MAQPTFLQLVNTFAAEAGVSGNASSVSTVLSQTGESANLVRWIKQAHNEIQAAHDNWRWMRSRFTVNTVAGTDSYAYGSCTDSRLSAVITRFERWLPLDDQGNLNIKRYLTSGGVAGEGWMTYLPWDYFQAIYRLGTQNNGPIINITIDPQNNLVTGPKPDDIYTITGEYQMTRKDFAADADTPEMPEQYTDLIWLKAMEKYGRFHAAPEVLSRWNSEGIRMLRELERNQLPNIVMAGPMA